MVQKDMREGRQVKARRTPRSVEFAFALHVGEQGNDSLLHSDEWLGRESVLVSPGVEPRHRPRASARLAHAAAADASLLPSEVG